MSGQECQYCDGPGGVKTFENQVPMPINGRVQCIDRCFAHLVAALNAANIPTVASCCGHKKVKGNIVHEGGRTLIIEQTPGSTDDWKKAIGAS